MTGDTEENAEPSLVPANTANTLPGRKVRNGKPRKEMFHAPVFDVRLHSVVLQLEEPIDNAKLFVEFERMHSIKSKRRKAKKNQIDFKVDEEFRMFTTVDNTIEEMHVRFRLTTKKGVLAWSSLTVGHMKQPLLSLMQHGSAHILKVYDHSALIGTLCFELEVHQISQCSVFLHACDATDLVLQNDSFLKLTAVSPENERTVTQSQLIGKWPSSVARKEHAIPTPLVLIGTAAQLYQYRFVLTVHQVSIPNHAIVAVPLTLSRGGTRNNSLHKSRATVKTSRGSDVSVTAHLYVSEFPTIYTSGTAEVQGLESSGWVSLTNTQIWNTDDGTLTNTPMQKNKGPYRVTVTNAKKVGVTIHRETMRVQGIDATSPVFGKVEIGDTLLEINGTHAKSLRIVEFAMKMSDRPLHLKFRKPLLL